MSYTFKHENSEIKIYNFDNLINLKHFSRDQ